METPKQKNGFSLVEMLIVIALLALLASIGIPVISGYQNDAKLSTMAVRIVELLRYAQSKSVVGEETSTWGVHFDTSGNHFFALFEGASYATGTSSDIIYLTDNTGLSKMTINGGGNDIIFDRLTGKTGTYGSGASNRAICVTISSDAGSCRKGVVVNANGKISLQ